MDCAAAVLTAVCLHLPPFERGYEPPTEQVWVIGDEWHGTEYRLGLGRTPRLKPVFRHRSLAPYLYVQSGPFTIMAMPAGVGLGYKWRFGG